MSELLKNAHAALLPMIHPLLSDLLQICCFVLSYPLYLSYFVFFLPYFLKVLSFLSPLFITVSLLLLSLLALSSAPHDGVLGRFLGGRAEEDVSFSSVVGDGCGNSSVELEAYKTVFEISSPELVRVDQEEDDEVIKGVVAEQVVILGKDQSFGSDYSNMVREQADFKMASDGTFRKYSSVIYEDSSDVALPENDLDEIGNQQPEVIKHITEEKISEEHLKKQEEEEEEANFLKISSLQSTNEDEGKKSESFARNCLDDQRNNGNNLGSYGSMRKEKEWKRTLACKLFEERHNGGSVEDMDMLWETYETADHEKVKGSPLSKSRAGRKKKKQNENTMTNAKTKSKKGSILDQWLEEEDDEEEIDNSQLCCLQALKLSSGKTNLGLGKPNLVKMSKAWKGIGWLHHVTAKNVTKTYKY